MSGFSSNKGYEYCDMSTPTYEKVSSCLEENRTEEEADIHEVKCKSPQGGCIRGKVEVECTARFLVGDMKIIDRYVSSCMGGDTHFGSDPKLYYKS